MSSYDEESNDEQSQQWIVVTKNKNNHKGPVKNKQIHGRGTQNLLNLQNTQDLIQKFISSKSFLLNKQIIEKTLEKVQAVSNQSHYHVECLGLGNFLSNKKSFIQLQFLELIILPLVRENFQKTQANSMNQKFESPQTIEQSFSVNSFDPAFTKQEIKYFQKLKYTSVQKFMIHPNKINIFFMPHCQRFLYEAVYSQYSHVQNKNLTPLIIIGNSIQEYKERSLLIKQKIPQIFVQIQPKQQHLFDFQNALNDTFVLT